MKENYPFSVLEEKVNSVDVSIIGVEHTAKFFEEYKSFFEEKISQADSVVIEGVSAGNFWEFEFYKRIGEIAKSQQKSVYMADTLKALPASIDIVQGIAGVTLIYLGATGILREISGQDMNLLSNIGNLSIGAYLFFGSVLGRVVREIRMGSHYGLDNILLYGYHDYRDTVIASGINKLCNENNGIKKFVCIHGDSHSHPIRKYLKNPKLRRIKRLTYLPYDLISYQSVREYIPIGNGWKRKRNRKMEVKTALTKTKEN